MQWIRYEIWKLQRRASEPWPLWVHAAIAGAGWGLSVAAFRAFV